MFAGPKYNEFTSSILVNGIPLVEQSGEAEPSDLMAVATQKCYIPIKYNDTFTIQFNHHKRRPENKDFMVVVKIDGYEVNRAIMSNGYHAMTTIDAFFTAEQDDQGNTSYKRNTFQVQTPTKTYDPSKVPNAMELGKIEVEVYRGARTKPGNSSKLIVFQKPMWLGMVKSEETRLCMKPGETTDADPHDAVNKWSFTSHARDHGDPWFKQVYEYRLLEDLHREGLVTNDPAITPKIPVILPKGKGSRVNNKALEVRLAALENQVQTLKEARPAGQARTDQPTPPVSAVAASRTTTSTPIPRARQSEAALGPRRQTTRSTFAQAGSSRNRSLSPGQRQSEHWEDEKSDDDNCMM